MSDETYSAMGARARRREHEARERAARKHHWIDRGIDVAVTLGTPAAFVLIWWLIHGSL